LRRVVVLMAVLDRLVARCAVLLVLVLLCLLMLALHLHLHLHLLMVLLELLRLESLKRKREEARELTPGGLRSGDRLSESNLLLELLQLLEFPLFVHLAQAQLLPPLDELLSDLLLLLRAQLHVPFAPLRLCRECCECGVRTPPPGGDKNESEEEKNEKRQKSEGTHKLLLLSYKAWIEPAFLVLFLPPGRRRVWEVRDGTRGSGGGKAWRALLKRLLKMLRLMLWNEGLLWLLELGVRLMLLLHLQERLVMELWLGLKSVLWQERAWLLLDCRRRQ